MNILIADPDWRFAQQAGQYLEERADNVSYQNSILAAIAQVNRGQTDLVILAAELAEDSLVQAIYNLPSRPAILLTDHMDRFDRAWRVWQKCGDELLMKPMLRTEELHGEIVAAMENAAAGTIMRHKQIAASA